LITGEANCVGGSASKNHFNSTAPFTDFFLTNKPLKNEALIRNIGRLENEGFKNKIFYFYLHQQYWLKNS
jgi:hypothetical protein